MGERAKPINLFSPILEVNIPPMNHDSADFDGDDDSDAIGIAILGDKKRKSPIKNRIRTLVAAYRF